MKNRLAILARDASGKIISKVVVSVDQSDKKLKEIMPIARNMLRIKRCSRTEIYPFESATSQYQGPPLAVLWATDLFRGISVP